MRRRLGFALALFAFIAASETSRAHASAWHNIGFAPGGSPQCFQWSPDEKFTGHDGTSTWFTWDDKNVYVGWVGGGAASEKRIVALDLDPGTNDKATVSYAGVSFTTKTSLPDVIVEVSNNNVYVSTRSGSTLTTATNPTGTKTTSTFVAPDPSCSAPNFVEVQIPRALLMVPGTSYPLETTVPFAFTSYFTNSAGAYVYGSVPASGSGACNPSGGAPQTFHSAVLFKTSGVSIAPNTYGTAVVGSTTTLASSANPSVSGQPVTLSSVITKDACDGVAVNGNVSYFDGATKIGFGAVKPAAGFTTGSASFAYSAFPVGSRSLTAVYDPLGSPIEPSASDTLVQVVGAAATTTSVATSKTPTAFGELVTFTATVAPVAPGAGTVVGNVAFYDGATGLGTVPLDATDKASLSTSSLASGVHSITAKYQATAGYSASTSSAITQTVGPVVAADATPEATPDGASDAAADVIADAAADAVTDGTADSVVSDAVLLADARDSEGDTGDALGMLDTSSEETAATDAATADAPSDDVASEDAAMDVVAVSDAGDRAADGSGSSSCACRVTGDAARVAPAPLAISALAAALMVWRRRRRRNG